MLNTYKWLTGTLLLILVSFSLQAQSDKELLAQLADEQQETVNALVLYPKEIRSTLMEASLHPELLVKMDRMQKSTSQAFQDLLGDRPEAVRQMVWDLTRYPNLIHTLIQKQKWEANEWKVLLKDFPEVIHERAKKAHNNYFGLLAKMDELEAGARLAFDELIAPYSPETQKTFRELLEIPEILTILTDNIQLTVLVGDVYKKDPQWVISKTDSMSLEVAKANLTELEDWKKELEDDPEAMKELETSAKEFAAEYGYDDLYYDDTEMEANDDDLYYEDDEPEIQVYHHYYHHYPYWYGYPSWYVYPRWRPYPLWWDWGFYYPSSGFAVVINLPSFYFSNWYFYHPHHHYHYPYLSNHFVRHYYGHRNSSSSVAVNVDRWKYENRTVLSEKSLSTDKNRVARLREFGEFESERRAYNHNNVKPLNQKSYLEKNREKYPGIKTDKAQKIPKDKKVAKKPKRDKSIMLPKNRTDKVPDRKRVDPSRKTSTKKPGKIYRKDTKRYKIDKGTEFHKRTWEKQAPKTRTTRPKARTKPKVKSSGNKKTKVRKPNN